MYAVFKRTVLTGTYLSWEFLHISPPSENHKLQTKQDARYAPGYFRSSIESGNLKFTSSLVKRILHRI